VLTAHRAAVNAVSLSPDFIVSGSGDRSIRLWDTHTGELLRTFDNHHTRGIASIAFNSPSFIVSGSSDKHLRYFDFSNSTGWGTTEELRTDAAKRPNTSVCSCRRAAQGSDDLVTGFTNAGIEFETSRCAHSDLVRSVAFNDDWVVSGSYDLAIKVESLFCLPRRMCLNCISRFGTAKRVDLLQILLRVTLVVSSV
jgi:F-box and WD-40 domain protein 1/11